MKDAGTSASQHMQYAQKQFQKSIAEFGQQASELLNRLQTNPTTQSDGLYDAQTNHGKNQPAQTIWNNRLSQIKLGDTSFRLALAMAGVM
jgi:hypothetical protein